MTELILSGACGQMGRAVAALAAAREDCQVAAGIDRRPFPGAPFPIYPSPEQYDGPNGVLVDFSHPDLCQGLLALARERRLPAVICTTGLREEQIGAIHEAASEIPIFFSANMSLGVSLLRELCKRAAQVLGGEYDIEIIERHHNQKLDAPSGAALMLADALSGELSPAPQYVYDRHSRRMKRPKNEIGIHSVRGGTIVGEHEVLFCGEDEVITLSHSASSKRVFAAGALRAAIFLQDRAPGLYDMGDLV